MMTQTKGNQLALSLARPQLVRRCVSGRYTVRYRLRGVNIPLVSLSLRTANRREALLSMNMISDAARLFLLDKPDATPAELNARLKEVAETLLTDAASDYWSSNGSIDHLGDLTGALRSLSLQRLTMEQQIALSGALKVIQAAEQRVHCGDPQPLIDVITSTASTAISTEIKQSVVSLWSSLVDDCITEKRLTLKESSVKDLVSSLRTITAFIPESATGHTLGDASKASDDILSRPMWLKVRDDMVNAGLAVGTINKCLTKASMVIEYALLNRKLTTGSNPIKRMKLKAVETNRKPFSAAQLASLGLALRNIKEPHRRSLVGLGLVTGARIGELVQLRPSDVVTIDGVVYIDINDNDGKSLKNANSKRLVPLTDGLYGFSLPTFLEDVKTAEDASQTLCKVTRDSASKWFNEVFVSTVLGDASHSSGLTFHSLRHSMATECKAAGVSEIDAGSILGHKAQSITYGLYGKTQALGRLVKALGRLVKALDTLATMASTLTTV